MSEIIKQSKQLTDEEGARLFGWGDDPFGATGFHIANRPPELHFVLAANGLAMSHMSGVHAEVIVGEQTLLVGGIGGVVTRGDAQGKGYAGRLLRHAVAFFKSEWKVDAGMLFCFERLVPYYAAQGWQLIESPVLIEQPAGQVEYPARAMMLPIGSSQWPQGAVQVNGLPW